MFAPKKRVSDRRVCLFIYFLVLTLLAERGLRQVGAATPLPKAFAASGSRVTDNGAGVLTSQPGSSARREIAAGEYHEYKINIETNQFLRVTVAQQGLSVHVAVSEPGGKRVAEAGVPNGTKDILQVSMISEVSGAYRLEVRSLESHAAGSYEIRIAESRSATAEDKSRVAAERLFVQGEELFTRETAESVRRAIGMYEGAFALWREVSDHEQEAIALFRIGQSYNYLGENRKAVEYYELALGRMPDAIYKGQRASMLNAIGSSYLNLGENQKALTYFSQALLLSRQMGNKIQEARSIYYLGIVYMLVGDNDRALECLNQALTISREIDDRSLMIYTLQSVGIIYSSTGKYSEALKFLHKALALSHEIADKRGEAWAINRLGRVYAAQGRTQEALAYYEQALRLSRDLGMRDGVAETLYDVGMIHSAAGRIKESLDCFSQALSLSREIMDQRTEMKVLYEIARIERRRGNLEASRFRIEAALSIVDLLHAKIGDQELELRASYFASAQKYYEFYISLLMQFHRQRPSQGFDAAALQVSERARARSLLEILTQPSVRIPDAVDPQLVERERSLRQMIAIKKQPQSKLLGRENAREQAESVAKEINQLTVEVQNVEAKIRMQSLPYDALTQPRFLSAAEIQAQVVSEDTLLLEYALCEDGSFLWAVTPHSIISYELPGRAAIEAAARDVYELMKRPTQYSTTRSADLLESEPARGEPEYREASLKLSNMLLNPVSRQLGGKRLIIVTQGALQFIPFGALPVPSGAGSQQGESPLIVHHEIVYLPSASLLPVLRSEAASRKRPTKTVAVIADPVLGKDDPRVYSSPAAGGGSSQSEVGTSPGNLTESATSKQSILMVAGHNFLPLPSTRWEAERITSLAPPSESMKALGFEANRRNATSGALNQYRIIHFATHALINNRQPELSGILLSMVDKQGLQQDGFLSLNDIFNMKLSADLVVLSACSTGLGKEVGGEGIVGLTRAFMYAGAPRVIVSLWNVDDRSTADLMARFYEKMLKEKLEPAAALREAQIAMWRNGSRQPYYWAGFVLQGASTLTK